MVLSNENRNVFHMINITIESVTKFRRQKYTNIVFLNTFRTENNVF